MKNGLLKEEKQMSETIFNQDQKVCSEEKIYDIFHSSKNTL